MSSNYHNLEKHNSSSHKKSSIKSFFSSTPQSKKRKLSSSEKKKDPQDEDCKLNNFSLPQTKKNIIDTTFFDKSRSILSKEESRKYLFIGFYFFICDSALFNSYQPHEMSDKFGSENSFDSESYEEKIELSSKKYSRQLRKRILSCSGKIVNDYHNNMCSHIVIDTQDHPMFEMIQTEFSEQFPSEKLFSFTSFSFTSENDQSFEKFEILKPQLDRVREAKFPQIVTSHWIEDCFEHYKIFQQKQKVYYIPILRLSGVPKLLPNIIIGVTGYSESEEKEVRLLTSLLGFGFLSLVSKKYTTHLVVGPGPVGPKFKKAMEWLIPIVTGEWLNQCFISFEQVPEKPYLHPDAQFSRFMSIKQESSKAFVD